MVIYQYDMPMPDHPLFPLPDILFMTPEIMAHVRQLPRLYESLKHTTIVAVNNGETIEFPPLLASRGTTLSPDCKLTTLLALLDNNRHEQIQQ